MVDDRLIPIAHHAEEEGIRFDLLVAPIEVLGDERGWVSGLKCVRMELGEPDASGRRRPVPVAGSEYVIPCDIVVVAIGTMNSLMAKATSASATASNTSGVTMRARETPPAFIAVISLLRDMIASTSSVASSVETGTS